jgi:cytochrome c1
MTGSRRSRLLLAAAVGLAVLGSTGCGGGGATIEVGGGARASRAPAEIAAYGCGSCHTIAGVSGANADIGPELRHFADRRYIAGRLPNTAPNLIRWIRSPQQVDPGNVMPDLNVSDQDARDIAAYLYSH